MASSTVWEEKRKIHFENLPHKCTNDYLFSIVQILN